MSRYGEGRDISNIETSLLNTYIQRQVWELFLLDYIIKMKGRRYPLAGRGLGSCRAGEANAILLMLRDSESNVGKEILKLLSIYNHAIIISNDCEITNLVKVRKMLVWA